MTNIGLFGCKSTTYECLLQLVKDGVNISTLITITPEQAERNQVAGYYDLRAAAQGFGIKTVVPESYSLQAEADKLLFSGVDLDCGLVIGWQRLIPGWLLEKLRLGVYGMHGSPEPLPRGRGRSPLNWSLLNGKTSFLTHLFRYDAGVDSGAVVDVQKFEINSWDDCDTLHKKK